MGHGGDGEKEQCIACCGCAGIITIIVVVFSSFGSVGDTEVAVAYDTVMNSLDETEVSPGFKTKPTFGEFIRWPTIYTQLSYSASTSAGGMCHSSDDSCGSILCNSKDGLEIDLDVNLQVKPMRSKIYELSMLYKDFESYRGIVELNVRSGCRHACSNFTASMFQEQRSAVQAVMKNEVDRLLGPLSCTVLDLQLTNVDLPDLYENEKKNQQRAMQDIQLAERERDQVLTQAQTVKASNDVTANLTVTTAKLYAEAQAAVATARAAALTSQFDAYSSTYSAIMRSQNLTVKGLLAYIGNRIVYKTQDANINLDAPSDFSVQAEL